jgi:hypothetical protein
MSVVEDPAKCFDQGIGGVYRPAEMFKENIIVLDPLL